MRLGIQQPCAADETDVAEAEGMGGVANRVRSNRGLCSVQDGHRQAQVESIGRSVRHRDVRRMDVVDDRLAEGGEAAVDLIAQEELVAVEIAVIDGDPPFAGPEICQLGFALSPQTGGRSEEHTSELQSRLHLVCRLLLEKKKKNIKNQRRVKREKTGDR